MKINIPWNSSATGGARLCENKHTLESLFKSFHKVRILTQLTTGSKIDSGDPGGQCKGIREARIAKAIGGGAIMQ